MPGGIGLGDTHFPWVDKKAVKEALAYIRLMKPSYIVQLGDLADKYSDTSFAKSLNILTPEEEHKRAKFMGIEFWKEIRQAAGKKCELFQILGNHDERPLKRIRDRLPEQEHLVREALADFWRFEGVTTIQDPTDELIIDDVLWTHGHGPFGSHMSTYKMSVVCGHLHKGAVAFERISIPRGNKLEHKVIWEANAGFLGDPMALPLRYRQKKNLFKYTKGLFHLDDYGPRFVSLEGV
jgi:predicted phosphodiesterase